MKSFLDTNILLYAGSNALKDAAKKEAASALVASLDFCISTQVIQEYLSNALGKKDLGISEAQIDTTLTCLADVPVQAVTYSLIIKAWQLRSRFKISHWDATIIAAALELGCHTLYSEDFNHGQDYGGVRVVNPFLDEAAASPI